MKAPRKFDTFVRKLFIFENGGVRLNADYIGNITIKNSVSDPIFSIFTCLTVGAFKELYEEEIADKTRFTCNVYDSRDPKFSITASRHQGHARNYIINFNGLRDYAETLRIMDEEKKQKRDRGKNTPLTQDNSVQDERLTTRFGIMEVGD